MTGSAQLLGELKALRRGRGIQRVPLVPRLGPALTEIAGVAATDPDEAVRNRVVDLLDSRLAALPPDLATCARAAFALPPAPVSRFLDERLAWAAGEIDRDARTVRRRVDEALQAVAADLARPPAPASGYAPDGWRVVRLDATVRLDVDSAYLVERRTIAAVQDGLDRIRVGFSVPRPAHPVPHPLKLEVLDGGTLIEDEEASSPSYLTGWVRLPRPLALGDRHEYAISLTGPPPREMQPFYVLTPLWPCDRFVVTITFPRLPRPRSVWLVDGAPTRLLDDPTYRRHPLEPDDAGRVTIVFERPQLGLSHGLHWQW